MSVTETIALTGQQADASAGAVTVIAGSGVSVNLTGNEITAAVGALAVSLGLDLTGQESATTTGQPEFGITAALSGQQADTSAGSVAPSVVVGGDITVALTGRTVTALAGALGVVKPAPQDYVECGYVADGYVTALTVSQQSAMLIYQLALLNGLIKGSPLAVSSTSRTAGDLVQTISESGAVTITTTATPAGYSQDLDTLIAELAALHGLGVPLSVTATSRSAGSVVQTFSQSGDTTTVVRA